ncbi:polysaccharide biosynthesis protein domain-containing protein [Desulfonema limicola]|uniref:Polysaccharide biosynthesis protein domain-containing protein n=1 Tax=Desulfonema limicola TaxID=45656 RepID=A0A975BDN3_9BACT|nr:MOP flippase family protein [Desulfonema limicola]QTA83259.1 polysaccharide biosynthesis protein domain-containing protein [Desulfonema limicola]
MHKDIKKQTISGVRWTVISTIFTTAIQFVQLIILTRLLGPKIYGIMAMLMVSVGLAQIFAEMGLSSAIIQRKDPTKDELSTIYWINVIAGLVIFILICLFSPIIAKFFNTEEITFLLPVASVSFVILSFGIQCQTLLQKELNFDIIAKISITSNFLAMLIAILLAWKEYGIWSLVLGSVSNSLFQTGFLIYSGWKRNILPNFHFKWSDTRGYLSFGFFRIGAMSSNYLNSRVDQLVIGSLIGLTELGYYNIAFRLTIEPIQKINPILTNVAFPVFSKIQDDNIRLKRAFFKMIKLLMSVNAPVLIGLAVVSPSLIPLIIGEQWIPAIPLVQILSFYTLIRSIGNAGGSLIIAKGKANWTLYWNLILILIIPAVIYYAGFNGNIIHICFALVVLQFILFLCHYIFFIKRLIGSCFFEYLKILSCPIFTALLMCLIILICSQYIIAMPLIFKLTIQIFTGVITYMTLSWYLQRELFVEFDTIFPFHFKRWKDLTQKVKIK